jgi:hypothetical protein
MLALRAVLDAKPDVFNHNVETIHRLVFARALTGNRASVRMGSFRAFAGRTLSFSLPVKRRMRSGRIDSKERLFQLAFQCLFC